MDRIPEVLCHDLNLMERKYVRSFAVPDKYTETAQLRPLHNAATCLCFVYYQG